MVVLTILTRTQETAHKAEIADQTIRTAVVDIHDPSSSSPTLRVVLALNSLLHQVLVARIPTPHTEATTITSRCGMQPWLNNNSNRVVQVSKPGRQVLDDDRRALLCDVVTVTMVSLGNCDLHDMLCLM